MKEWFRDLNCGLFCEACPLDREIQNWDITIGGMGTRESYCGALIHFPGRTNGMHSAIARGEAHEEVPE